MKAVKKTTPQCDELISSAETPPPRGQLLLFEPDELTRWSITTYLEPWFVIETVDSSEAARRLAAEHSFAALILSGPLPSQEVAAVHQIARKRNPAVRTIHTVAETCESTTSDSHTVQLEKPFDLADLARLLGVSEQR